MSAGGRAIFLSYASQDAEPARRMCCTPTRAGSRFYARSDSPLDGIHRGPCRSQEMPWIDVAC